MNLTSEETDIIVGFSFPGDGSVTLFSIEEWRAVMLKSNVLLCTRWGKLFKKDILLSEVLVCPKGIKVGEDMIMNIKAAFHSDKPVTILHSKVYEYNRNDGSISYNYKWSLGRLFNLYLAVRDSLPKAMAKPEYYNAIVQNGLTSIKGIVLKGQKKGRKNLVSSALALQISKDVLEWAYAPSFEDRLLLKHSSSRLTRLYFMSKRMLEVLFQIIRRKLLKK